MGKGIALMQKSKAISFRPGNLSTLDWRVDKRLAHKRKMKSKIRKRTRSKSRIAKTTRSKSRSRIAR